MTTEELRSFIDNYKTVEEKIEHVFEVLQTIDYPYWTTGRRIINFMIDEGYVCVSYDDSSMGCWDEGSNSFDAEWLLLSDEELIEVAKQDRNKREEEEKRKEEEKKKIETEDKERREREQYEKLKAKFENGK